MKWIITFSGLDGCGKSEQCRLLSDKLTKVGIKHVVLYSRIGRNRSLFLSRHILLAVMNVVAAEKESQWKKIKQDLITKLYTRIAIVDTIFHYALLYRVRSIGCDLVLCDRYIWDSYIDMKVLNRDYNIKELPLWKLLEFVAPKASISILLQIPAIQANDREQQRANDYIEPLDRSVQREKLYTELIADNAWSIVVDGTNSRKTIQREIINYLIKVLPDVKLFRKGI